MSFAKLSFSAIGGMDILATCKGHYSLNLEHHEEKHPWNVLKELLIRCGHLTID